MNLLRGVRMLAVLLPVVASVAAEAQQQEPIRIEKLVAEGWDVAGYVAAWENRSLILFKHREHHYLVQCSVLIDVMRNPRVATYCYEIR
jgi:predicted metal-binding membrane protein